MRLYSADLTVSMDDDGGLSLNLKIENEEGIPPEFSIQTLPNLYRKVADQIENDSDIVKVIEQ